MVDEFTSQRELDEARTKLAATEREHAAAAKLAEEASSARQAVTAKTDQLTKQRDDVMVVRRADPAAIGMLQLPPSSAKSSATVAKPLQESGDSEARTVHQ